jgi:hypothetical protein
MSGHFFAPGEKVVLEIKELYSHGFDTQYGRSYIVVYETKCGKIVKYMGGSPIQLQTPEQLDIDLKIANLRSKIKNDNYVGGVYIPLTAVELEEMDKIYDEIEALQEKQKNNC